MYLIGAASSAGAATMIVLSSALASSSVRAMPTTVDIRWPIATYTDTTPVSLLLMIVSIAIAVLPVWRSPMISSRWPRPIGISASIALRPVCIGSCTQRRGGMPGPLAVERIAERVDHAAEQALADRHVDDLLGPLDRAAFLDVAIVAEDHDADIVVLEVQRHAAGAVLELDHLAGLDLVEPIDPGDAV